MAPSQMNVFVILLVIILLPVIMAAHDHVELASTAKYELPCGAHMSHKFEGPCFDGDSCNSVCIGESSDNIRGWCDFFECWCQARCTSETSALASAPIRQ